MSTYTSTRQKLHCDLTSAKAESPVDPEKIKRLEVELKVLESDRLRQQARRWNLELYGSAVGSWETDSYRQWLPQAQQYALAEKLISEARFALIKKWVDLLSPILSVVISISAFVLALLALYFQWTGRIR
jgi:hypothetical protein